MKAQVFLDEDMNWHVGYRVLDEMKAHGGPFAARLAGLYQVAEQANRNLLVNAFVALFEKFEKEALARVDKDTQQL